jgi:hypothetical protein
MSSNCLLYAEKMREIRAARRLSRPLQRQLEELLRYVLECEEGWGLDDRVDQPPDRRDREI